MTPDPEKIRFWEARAPAYDRLCRRWDIFSQLSNRLIDLLPAELQGPVLDIGAGSGLTSELLLARHPRCQAILIEPSEAMLSVARQNLAGRPAQFFAMGLDGAPGRELHVVAALASASMQFVDLEPAFATLADIVAPGGFVAFNLWWHHWEETAARKCMTAWQAVAKAACLDAQLPPPPPRAAAAPKTKTRTELTNASCEHGFHLLSEHCDEYLNPISFGVDYEAMDPNWPVKGLGEEARQALLTKMHELAHGRSESLISTRFLFQRTDNSR
jgi:SAM-dependent methyltransferase